MSSEYAAIEASTKRLHDFGHKGPETKQGRHGTAERMIKFLPAFLASHKLPTFNLSPNSLLNGSTGIPAAGRLGHGWIENLDLAEAVQKERDAAAMSRGQGLGGFAASTTCMLAPAMHPAWQRIASRLAMPTAKPKPTVSLRSRPTLADADSERGEQAGTLRTGAVQLTKRRPVGTAPPRDWLPPSRPRG